MEEEEEEGIGDVDLFSLINEHTKLTINAKWLQHLQVRTHANRLLQLIVDCVRECLLGFGCKHVIATPLP